MDFHGRSLCGLPFFLQAQEGASGWSIPPLMYGGETLVGKCMLRDASERTCSETPAVHLGGVKQHWNYDPWVKCATFAECKTDISAMLAVKSGVVPSHD